MLCNENIVMVWRRIVRVWCVLVECEIGLVGGYPPRTLDVIRTYDGVDTCTSRWVTGYVLEAVKGRAGRSLAGVLQFVVKLWATVRENAFRNRRRTHDKS
jgi:hypothetical protein